MCLFLSGASQRSHCFAFLGTWGPLGAGIFGVVGAILGVLVIGGFHNVVYRGYVVMLFRVGLLRVFLGCGTHYPSFFSGYEPVFRWYYILQRLLVWCGVRVGGKICCHKACHCKIRHSLINTSCAICGYENSGHSTYFRLIYCELSYHTCYRFLQYRCAYTNNAFYQYVIYNSFTSGATHRGILCSWGATRGC